MINIFKEVKIMTKKTVVKKNKKSNNALVAKLAIIFIIIAATFFYYKSQQSEINYRPCATSAEGSNLATVETSAEMIGSNKIDELFIAAPEGSKIFSKGGLNYIVANDGADEIYFSLCSAKIIDDKVMVIEGFNLKEDKLKIFCAHNHISASQIKIIHDEFEGFEVTYVQVEGKHSNTAIALLGNIEITPEDVILNEPFTTTKE